MTVVRKLDFFVFGMPRGGTSAVARYISAVDALHCGQEVFPVALDHSKLDIPTGFLEPQANYWIDSSIEEVTRKADTIQLYGNKTPTYFYRLSGLMTELDNAPSIACVRNPRSVAVSYSTRSLNPKDNWKAGRRGLFAIGDALMLAHALHHTPRDAKILVLPQKALLIDWMATMEKAISHIAPGVSAKFNDVALEKINKIKSRQSSSKKADLEDVELRALKRIEKDGLFDLFNRDDAVLLDEVRDDLARIVHDGPGNPVGFILRLAADHPDPIAREYANRWAKPARRAWQSFKATA